MRKPPSTLRSRGILLLVSLLACHTAQADVSFNFDTNAQGWTVINGGELVHQASGGNPGGFLQITDKSGDDFLLVAPAALHGDGSAYLNGTISFDARNLNGDAPDWAPFGEITLSGPAGSISVDVAPPGQPLADGQWHHYSSTLSSAVWGPSLSAILAQVTHISFKGEFHNGISEVLGIDNIRISAVPEPTSASLLGLGMLGLGLWRLRTPGRR